MRWPWMARTAYDGLVVIHEAMRQDFREQREEWRKDRIQLLTHLAALQRQGFKAPDPVPSPSPETPGLPAQVEAAIIATGMDPRGVTARNTAQLALNWLAEGMDPREVARRIERGAEG
jgi:hypothetical protein